MDQKQLGLLLTGIGLVLVIVLSFVKADFDSQSAALCEVYAASPKLEMEDCPAHQSNTSWLVMVAFGFGVLIVGAGLYQYFSARKGKVILPKMDGEEKQVYNFLKGKDGSAYQSDLIKETGFSKVKLTRTLDKLESKGVVERKRRGMTNIVVLK